MKKLKILHPLYYREAGVAYTCMSLTEAFELSGVECELTVCAKDESLNKSYIRPAIPSFLKSIVYKSSSCLGTSWINSFTEWKFVQSVCAGDVVYLWPGVSLKTFQKLKAKGCIVVTENINCHQLVAKKILDVEKQKVGEIGVHTITDSDAAEESAKLVVADFVFSPSPKVTESLLVAEVPQNKILKSSYGWDPARISAVNTSMRNNQDLKFLFVGRVGIRKGIHLLAEAWQKANVKGELLIAGGLEAGIRERFADFFDRDDVATLGFVDNVQGLYQKADVFIFPSLEEGSPLVTYEAMGAGLPVIVSEMGAGGIARDGLDGFVCDPHDVDTLAKNIREMSTNKALLSEFSTNARARAQAFTWDKVGTRRKQLLVDVLS